MDVNQIHNTPPSLGLLQDQDVSSSQQSSDDQKRREAENPTSPSPTPAQKEWRTWKLQWWWMILLIIFEIGLITAVIYLVKRSTSQNGIVSVPQDSTSIISPSFVIGNIWQYGLLWTTLPSLIMTIYRMMWDSIVSGTSDRQPFVELKNDRDRASSAKTTIMLDYKSHFSLFTWAVALGNKHFILGISMLISLIISVAVVPLTAHLFVAAPSQRSSFLSLDFGTEFNESALTFLTSLQPMIDFSTANHVYGATPPAWMTLEYSFEPFNIEPGIMGNITSDTNAYSASLDCQSFTPSESSAQYTDAGDGSQVKYQMNDRGCQISSFLTVQNSTRVYAQSWQSNCAGSVHGRIGIIAALYSDASPIKLANYSLISCNVTYWNTSGSLTVSVQENTAPQFVSFKPSSNISFHPALYQILEKNLHSYTFFDPSNNIFADAFGFSVYSYAQRQNAASPMTTDVVQNSTEALFQTLYAALTANILLQPATVPRTSTGELSVSVTRLFVVTPVAFSIVGILALALICNIGLFIYAYAKHSILLEEPVGLLGNAALLDQSQVSEFVTEFHQQHPTETKLRKFVEEKYSVKNSKCYIGESGEIMVENLVDVKEG